MDISFQVGLDVATSLSIVGAAVSYVITSRKQRKQTAAQYAVDNLKGFCSYLREAEYKFAEVGRDIRLKASNYMPPNGASSEIEKALRAAGVEAVRLNMLEVVMFVENLLTELNYQIRINLPLFSIDNRPPLEIVAFSKRLEQFLGAFKAEKSLRKEVEMSTEIDDLIRTAQLIVSKYLQSLLLKGS